MTAASPRRQAAPARPDGSALFADAATAWTWCMQVLAARRDGAGAAFAARGIRPCEADDVVAVVDRLYRQRRITLAHARTLRIYGERQSAPNPRVQSEREDAALWRQALAQMEPLLRRKGIIR
jgi:hypothetical protein